MLCLTVFAQNLHRLRVIPNSCSCLKMASAAKKPKVESSRGREKDATSSSGKQKKGGELNVGEEVNLSPKKSVGSVLEFPLNKKRIRILSKASLVKEDSAAILYWCSRDPRVQDNWAALYAQKLALKNHLPLHVCFCLLPRFLDATHRHFHFLLKGLSHRITFRHIMCSSSNCPQLSPLVFDYVHTISILFLCILQVWKKSMQNMQTLMLTFTCWKGLRLTRYLNLCRISMSELSSAISAHCEGL